MNPSWRTESRPLQPGAIANLVWFCPRDERTATELRELAPSEREKVWADMSGDGRISLYHVNVEEATFVADCLVKLNQEISKIRNKEAFELVCRNHPEFVHDRDFQLKFLRADRFDPKAAAERITAHFQEKRRLFGIEKIGREILLSDLHQEDIAFLESSGAWQFIPNAEHAGRGIVWTRYKNFKSHSLDSVVSKNHYK